MPWDERWSQLVLQRCQGTGAEYPCRRGAAVVYRRTVGTLLETEDF